MKRIFLGLILFLLGIGSVWGQSKCQAPTGLNVSDVGRTSATLGWTLGQGTDVPGSYFLKVTDDNGAIVIEDSTLVAPGLSTSLTGLTPNTVYHVTLQGDCRADYAGISGVGTLTFATLCNAIPMPWSHNFNDVTDGIECASSNNATFVDGAVRLRSTVTEWASILFPLTLSDIDKIEIDYTVRRGGALDVDYMIGVVTDPSIGIESFTPFEYDTIRTTEWKTRRFNTGSLPLTADTAAAICIFVPAGSAYELWIDNVNIHAKPNCLRVENVWVDQVNINSVRVWFDTDGTNNFTVKCTTESGATTTVNATTSPVTVNGLSSNEVYTATVIRNCTGESSEESLPAYFSTLCPVAPTPIMYEDFSQAELPECWQQKDGWICTEKLPFQTGLQDVNISIRRDSNDVDVNKGIELWLTPLAGDTTGAIKLGKIPFFFGASPKEETAGWHRYTYPITVSGDYYIMVKGETKDAADNWKINELSVTNVPTCRSIGRIGIVLSTQTSITIPWTPGGSETSWAVKYDVMDGTQIVQSDSVTVTQPQLTITNLSSGNEYTISGGIYAICSQTDISERHDFQVVKQTKCPASSVPFNETFDIYGANTVPSCWDGDKWLVTTYGVNETATQVLRLNNPDQLTGIATTYSPSITLNAGEEYLVRFDWISTICRGELSDFIPTILKISTDNGLTQTAIDTLPSNISEFEYLEYDISQWAGNDVSIIFESETSHGLGAAMIDNFQIVEKPSCSGMKQPTISNITTNTAVVTISDTLATSWDVTWGATGTQAGTGNVKRVNNQNKDTLTNLVAQRSYDVYVRRVCGSEVGEWTRKPVSFTTTCLASALPVEEGFENMPSSKLEDCFTHKNTNSFQYEVTGNASYNHTANGFKGIITAKTGISLIPTSTTAEETSTTLQAFKYVQLEANKNYEVSMWMRNEKSGNENFDCQVTFLVGTQIENAMPVGGAVVKDNNWIQSRNYFTVPADGDYFVGFRTSPYNTVSYKFIADDYHIEEVGCIPPVNCQVLQRSTTSAAISFTSSTAATRYEIVVDGVMSDTTITAGPITITGLTPNTLYTYRMRSVCPEGKSAWSEDMTFRTRCGGETVPYSENFERTASTDCWSSFGDGSAMRSNSQGHKGNASFYVSNKTVLLPEMDVTSLAGYTLNGWMYLNTSQNISWGVITDPNDISTLETLGSIYITKSFSWSEFEISFDSLMSPTYSDFANARHIAFVIPQGIEAYIDDIEIFETPDCRRPKDISYSNMTSNSITVNWNQTGSAMAWQVEAIPVGGKGTLQSRIVTTKPVVFNGLKAGASYKFEIRSICSPGDTSAVACGDVVSTFCGAQTAPFIENFEDYDGESIPRCWNVTTTSTAMTHRLWYVMGQGDNHYVRLCTAWIRDEETTELTSESIALASGKQWELSLNHAHNATCGPLEVMIRRSTESRFVTIGSITKDGTYDENVPHNWQKSTFNISSYAGSNVIIRLSAVSDNGQGAIYADNIEIKEIRPCKDIQSLKVSAGETDATVAITDTLPSHTSWQYVYGRKGIDPDEATLHITSSKRFTITGLKSENEYDVYVRVMCGNNDFSNWTRSTFKTINSPSPMPYICDFSDEEENSKWGIASSEGAASVFAIGNCSTAVKSGSNALYVSTDGGNNYLYNLNVAGTTVAYRLFYFGTGEYQFEIDWQCTGGHIKTPYDYARIYLQPADRPVDIAQSGYYYERYYPQDIIPLDGNRPFAKVSGGWKMTNETLDMTDREGYYYLVFVWSNDGSYGTAEYPLSVNDITVRKLSCPGVTSIVADNVTETSITAKVKGSTGFKWMICPENSMNAPLQRGNGDTDSTITVSGLDSSTKYWLFVSNNCNDDTQSEWKSLEFTTTCAANTEYPFSEDFGGADFPPVCWSIDGNGTWERYVDNYGDGNSHTGDAASLGGSTGTITRLVSPAMHFDASRDYKVSFWMSKSQALTVIDELTVLVCPNKRGTNGAVSLGTWATYDANTEEVIQLSCDIPATLPTGDYYILFEGHHNSSYVIIDDIEVSQYPICREFETRPTIINNSMNEITVSIDKGKRDTIEFGYALGNGNASSIVWTMKTTTGICTITGLTAGTTYTIYARGLCSNHDTTSWSAGISTVTQTSNCYAPVALRVVGDVSSQEVTLTWGGAPNATLYEYELIPRTGTTIRGTTMSDTVLVTGLSPRMQYTARVRCLCSGPDSTAWETISLNTPEMIATAPYFTGFEDALDNAQWNHTQSAFCNKFCIGTKVKKDGQNALYVSKDGSSKDLELPASTAYSTYYADFMTRLVHFTPGVYDISFDWRCNAYNLSVNSPAWEAFGRAFIVPEGTSFTPDVPTYFEGAPANAIEIYPGRMERQSQWQHQKTFINITTEGNYLIVFGWLAKRSQYATSGDVGTRTLVIDNLSVEELTCLPTQSLKIASCKHDEVKVKVTKSSNTPLEWALLTTNDEESITSWQTQTNDTIILPDSLIQPRSTYYLFVRQACDQTDKSPWQSIEIVVPAEAAALPYSFGFEDATESANWICNRNSQTNYFICGSDINNGGVNSMYITNNGSAHAFTGYNGSGNIVSYSYVYRTFYLTEGTYEWGYDWMSQGDNVHINDYGRAFLAPMSMSIKSGAKLPGLSNSSLPAGCIAIDNGPLYDQSTWTSAEGLITVTRAGYYNMIFYWENDASAETNPPLAIDNVRLREVFCLPATISVSNIGETTMRLTFTKDDTDAPILYTISTRDSHDLEDALISDTTYALSVDVTGLNASNVYYIYATVICSSEDSPWTRAVTRTNCGTVQGLPYEMGFEMLPVTTGLNNRLDDICWTTSGLGAQYLSQSTSYPYYIIYDDEDYLHSGLRGLRLHSSDEAYLYVMLPEFAEQNDLRMYFWYRNGFRPTESDRITVGYMNNGTFTALTTLEYATQMTQAFQDFPVLPAGSKLTFRYGGGSKNNFAALDDIRVIKLIDGGTILDTICYESDYTRNGFNVSADDMTVGDNLLSRTSISEHATDMDTVYHAQVYMRPQIITSTYDTICSGVSYHKGLFDIDIPTTKQYFVTYKSTVHPECDSIVALWLYVVPNTSDVFDTICQGETYTFGNQQLTMSGDYTDTVIGLKGCPVAVTLHLLVIDSMTVTNAQICNGSSYTFEGHEYYNAGTYRVPVISTHGCTINKVLNLTVLNSDTTYAVTICQGNQYVIGDTVISTAGSYVITRPSILGCNVTHRVTVTVTPAIEGHVYDYTCENKNYTGYGINNLKVVNDTVVYIQTKTGTMCDSIGAVHIQLVKTVYSTETVVSDSAYTWNENTYSKSGTYYYYTTSQVTGCDSVATLILTITGVGVDNIEEQNEVIVYPNPTTGFVFLSVTDDVAIEVKDLTGRILIRSYGQSVDLSGLADGIYFVNGIKVILKR